MHFPLFLRTFSICQMMVYLLMPTVLVLAIDSTSSCPQEVILEACAFAFSSLPPDFPRQFNSTRLIPYLKKNPKTCCLFIRATECALLATSKVNACHQAHMKLQMVTHVVVQMAQCLIVKC